MSREVETSVGFKQTNEVLKGCHEVSAIKVIANHL